MTSIYTEKVIFRRFRIIPVNSKKKKKRIQFIDRQETRQNSDPVDKAIFKSSTIIHTSMIAGLTMVLPLQLF